MEIINEHVERLQLKWRSDVKVHVDFERALRNACLKGIPTCKIIGCCFHFSQALNRQADVNMRELRRGKCVQSRRFKSWLALVRNLPLSELTNQSINWSKQNWFINQSTDWIINKINQIVNNFTSPILVPRDEAIFAWNHGLNEGPEKMDAKYMPHINKYIMYLKRTWLDDDALFHISEWSVDQSLTERTTNVAEGELKIFIFVVFLKILKTFENFSKNTSFKILIKLRSTSPPPYDGAATKDVLVRLLAEVENSAGKCRTTSSQSSWTRSSCCATKEVQGCQRYSTPTSWQSCHSAGISWSMLSKWYVSGTINQQSINQQSINKQSIKIYNHWNRFRSYSKCADGGWHARRTSSTWSNSVHRSSSGRSCHAGHSMLETTSQYHSIGKSKRDEKYEEIGKHHRSIQH